MMSFFSFARINVKLFLCKNVMVLYAMQIYEKHLQLVLYYHRFYGKLLYIFIISAKNAIV